MKTLVNLDNKLFLFIYTKTSNKTVKSIFNTITKTSKPFFIVAYILLLYIIYTTKSFDTFKICLFEPLLVLFLCKFLRKSIGRKRPYIIFKELNIQKKEDASFPSNHTASSFIISFMFFLLNPQIAFFMIFLAFIVSISRIIVGLHFPLDVLFGFLIPLAIYNIF